MTRIAVGDADDQCPERGPGLSHTQDGSPECVHCGQYVTYRRRKRKRRSRGEFSDYEADHIEFLRWLVREGRLVS